MTQHLITATILVLTLLRPIPGNAEEALRLVGTIESKGFTGAVFVAPDGQQTFYRLRDKLPDGAQIIKVQSNSIVLRNPDGSHSDLFISSPSKVPATGGAVVSRPAPQLSAPTHPSGEQPRNQPQRTYGRRSRPSANEAE